jgi:hypothetical protein
LVLPLVEEEVVLGSVQEELQMAPQELGEEVD